MLDEYLDKEGLQSYHNKVKEKITKVETDIKTELKTDFDKEIDKEINVVNSQLEEVNKNTKDLETNFNKGLNNINSQLEDNTLQNIETDAPLAKLNSVVEGNVIVDKIQGRTLVNIIKPTTLTTTSTSYSLYGVKTKLSNHGAKTMTLINSTDKPIAVDIMENGSWKRNFSTDKKSFFLINLTATETIQAIYGFFKDGWTEENKNDLLKVMVLDGEYTGSMPSYFEGIQSVGEDNENKIEISTCGKNLFDASLYFNKIKVIEGVGITENGFIANCTFNPSIGSQLIEVHIMEGEFKPKTVYIFNYNTIHQGTFRGEYNYIYTDNTKSPCKKPSNSDKTIKYISFTFGTQKEGGVSTFTNIKLEEAPITAYIPYQQDKSDISLSSPLREFDFIDKDGVHRNSVVRVLDGSEDGYYNIDNPSLTNTLRFAIMLNSPAIPNIVEPSYKVLCDKLPSDGRTTFERDSENLQVSFDGRLYIRILKSKLTTPDVEGFKIWLQANPLTVVYKSAEETIEPLNSSLVLQSFKDGYFGINSGAISPIVSLNFPTNFGERVTIIEDTIIYLRNRYYESLRVQLQLLAKNIELETSKQDKIDNTLTTTSKEIVGAINENKANIEKKQE